MSVNNSIINSNELVLITGSNGFIGSKVVKRLLNYGFTNLRCFVRHSSDMTLLEKTFSDSNCSEIEVQKGNLLSSYDCEKAVNGVSIIYHLAASTGSKSFADAYMNSVVSTRNLLQASLKGKILRRFVNVSSFSVYSNLNLKPGSLLDESCDIETHPQERGEAYCYAKVKQDEFVTEYCNKHDIPYTLCRPGAVYGPGKLNLTARIGIDTFGIFLHLGGSNKIPLTFVENCAEAIVLAGLKKGVDGEIFNIVDDDLPTSRQFLKMYKENVKQFRSLFIPYRIFCWFCCLWEKYSSWSEGQLPPVFTKRRCAAYWKGNTYSNNKLKTLLDWKQLIPFNEAKEKYFDFLKNVR